MNFGWDAPDHLAGAGCCIATIKINPLMRLQRALDPSFEPLIVRGMDKEPLIIQPLNEVALSTPQVSRLLAVKHLFSR